MLWCHLGGLPFRGVSLFSLLFDVSRDKQKVWYTTLMPLDTAGPEWQQKSLWVRSTHRKFNVLLKFRLLVRAFNVYFPNSECSGQKDTVPPRKHNLFTSSSLLFLHIASCDVMSTQTPICFISIMTDSHLLHRTITVVSCFYRLWYYCLLLTLFNVPRERSRPLDNTQSRKLTYQSTTTGNRFLCELWPTHSPKLRINFQMGFKEILFI